MPEPNLYFDGISANNNVLPPDTEGDIGFDPATGKKYYFQWVNLEFEIWDVTDPASISSVYGPQNGKALFSGLSGICKTHNDGDPIVLFDQLSDRWVASQFAYATGDFEQCIAVSASANPLGSWYEYSFQISTTRLGDYPKFAVWPDGYYMTLNQFTPRIGGGWDWYGAGALVFERAAMLNGASARALEYDLNEYGPGMLPATLTGPAPTPGTPAYFTEWDDAGSYGLGDPADTIRIWYAHTDWTNPANSTFGADAAHTANAKVTTTNVDPALCGNPNTVTSCIPQPGTSVKLDPISDRQMYRAEYRNFGSYQTLIGNHTVDANGADQAGIHWFELRNSGSGWGTAPYQEGVYAPADGDNRWMGSLAMDGAGDMALGYSVSSSTTYPSVRYTGRLSTDTLGLMPQGEANLAAGGGSQTDSSSRWGDYSTMSVDPTDDCTFWYTQEYYVTTSDAAWNTVIGSFKFPSCVSPYADVSVVIGGIAMSSSFLTAGSSTLLMNLPGANGGPVEILGSSGSRVIAAERVIYNLGGTPYGGTPVGYSEMMGYPDNQLTNNYWIPSYNNIAFDSQLRFANAGGSPTSVSVSMSGTTYGPYPLGIGESKRLSLPGANGGPVQITSPVGSKIVASERVIYNLGGTPFGGTPVGYSEMMAYPDNQLTNNYWIPSYNNIAFDSQLRFANAGGSPTSVSVSMNGTTYGPYPLGIGESKRLSLPGANGGPVQITSPVGSKIVASERVIYNLGGTPFGGTPVGYSEMMAYPDNQLTNNYWIPSYNNIAFDTQLRFANVGGSPATVSVSIGSTSYGSYPLAGGASTRLSLPGANGGPVQITSPVGSKIVASERVIYNLGGTPLGGTPVGYSEMMAYADNQVTNTYWIPSYNNIAFDSQLRFALLP